MYEKEHDLAVVYRMSKKRINGPDAAHVHCLESSLRLCEGSVSYGFGLVGIIRLRQTEPSRAFRR